MWQGLFERIAEQNKREGASEGQWQYKVASGFFCFGFAESCKAKQKEMTDYALNIIFCSLHMLVAEARF
jgi:hypothetical protein